VNTCGGIFYSFVPEKMPNYIDPKSLGLQPRIVVEDIDGNTLAIVINRKSRIIMADGRKILAHVKKIKKACNTLQSMGLALLFLNREGQFSRTYYMQRISL
jgi:hypothetical protein